MSRLFLNKVDIAVVVVVMSLCIAFYFAVDCHKWQNLAEYSV